MNTSGEGLSNYDSLNLFQNWKMESIEVLRCYRSRFHSQRPPLCWNMACRVLVASAGELIFSGNEVRGQKHLNIRTTH